MPWTPRPGTFAKSSTGGQLPSDPGDDRPGDRVLGGVLERRAEPAHLGVADHLDQGHPAGSEGAGVVEHDRVDLPGRLEHLGALDGDAQLRAAAGADQQCGGRGQAERARAGDDQHRHGSGESGWHAGAAAQPEPQGARGERDDDRHEDAGDPVGQPLDRRLPALGLFDEPGHLGQLGVGTDARRPDHHPPAGVDRRADHVGTRADLDRDRFAGDQRLVDSGGALDDDAVGHDLLPRPYDEQVADPQALDRPGHLGTVGEDGHVLRTQL